MYIQDKLVRDMQGLTGFPSLLGIHVDCSRVYRMQVGLCSNEWLSSLEIAQILNRSQEHLKSKLTAEQLLEKERALFARPDMQRIPEECKGLPALIAKLTQVQARCIQNFVPGFKQQVTDVAQTAGRRLQFVQAIQDLDRCLRFMAPLSNDSIPCMFKQQKQRILSISKTHMLTSRSRLSIASSSLNANVGEAEEPHMKSAGCTPMI